MAPLADILYLCYNGIAEPLVESQVVSYLRGLHEHGYRFTLLTFERQAQPAAVVTATHARLAALGIQWHSLRAHRGWGPLSSLVDVVRGQSRVQQLCRERRYRLIHARSFIPALIAARVKARGGVAFINDLRGFWVDEKVYRGRLQANGLVYRLAKWLEARVLRASDGIVSLTDRGQQALRAFAAWQQQAPPPMVTIPTCVDLARFTPQARSPAQGLVFGYVGSLSAEYLPDEVFRYFAAARQRYPHSRLHLVSRSDPAALHAQAARHAVSDDELRLCALPPEQVAAEVAQFDVALSFIRPHFAKLASCPTKVGEYLAAGVPVICNAGIGDIDRQIGDASVGCVLPDFSAASIERSLQQLDELRRDPRLRARCRQQAETEFALDHGVQRYATLYRQLLGEAEQRHV